MVLVKSNYRLGVCWSSALTMPITRGSTADIFSFLLLENLKALNMVVLDSGMLFNHKCRLLIERFKGTFLK